MYGRDGGVSAGWGREGRGEDEEGEGWVETETKEEGWDGFEKGEGGTGGGGKR